MSDKVFTIQNSKVTACPYLPKTLIRKMISILQGLTSKPLGLIKKKKYFPNKEWIIHVIWALDPNN